MTDYMREIMNANVNRPMLHTEMHSQENGKFDDMMLMDLPIAMAYVPMQTLGRLYEPEEALYNGTLFEVLNKPFLGKRL